MDDFIIRPLLLLAVCHSRHSPITQPPRSNCVNIPSYDFSINQGPLHHMRGNDMYTSSPTNNPLYNPYNFGFVEDNA